MRPPYKLSKDAKQYWKKLEPTVVASEANREALCMLCDALADYWKAQALIEAEGLTVPASTGGTKAHPAVQIKKIAGQQVERLTKQLKLGDTEEQDDLDKFMEG